MKNKLFLLIAISFSLFFLPNVNASTKTGINIDAHEHFNYYYEQKNGTGFYNFIKNTNFSEYFGGGNDYILSFFYTSDLENKITTLNNEYINIPSNAKYALLYRGTSGSCCVNTITRDGNDYTINYNSRESWDNATVRTRFIEFFDEDGNRISRYQPMTGSRSALYWNFSITYHISNYSDEDSANFTYLISSTYISNDYYNINNISSPIDNKIIVTDIIEDGEHYLIDDNDNYGGWLRKIFSLWSIDSVDVVDSDLTYFKTNVIKDHFPSLKQILDYGVRPKVPDNFSAVILNDDNLSVMLFPKDINNNDIDRDIYYQGVDVLNRHFDPDDGDKKNDIIYPQIVMDLYNYNNNFKVPHNNANLGVLTAYSYVTQKAPLSEFVLNSNIDNYVPTDYSYTFSLYGSSVKLSANIFYNPDAYSICIYNESNSNSCTYVNPKTGEQGTLSMLQFKNILKKSTFPGETYEDRCSRLPDYDSSYNYDTSCNKTTLKDSTSSGGVFDNLGDIGDFLNNFKSIISTIFSFVVLILSALPPEIKSVLLFGLIAGTVITLYKIIRG